MQKQDSLKKLDGVRGAILRVDADRQAKRLRDGLKRALKRGPVTLAELSSRFDRGVEQISSIIEEFRALGLNCEVKGERAEISKALPAGGVHRIDPKTVEGRVYEFGAIGDSHLGSKYARLDVLNRLYDIFEAEGIKDVYHGGNLIDGESRFNKFDLVPGAVGLTAQCKIAARDYPKRTGVTTHFICGDDHEGWYAQREGINIGQVMQDTLTREGRADMHYLSYLEADILLPAPKGQTWIKLMHPGGGSAYAISYASQKIVESFQGGEKPALLLLGHYHKMDFCLPREVFCLQLGTTCDQTPFMRKLKLQAHVGGWKVKITQAADGHISRIATEFIRFYDRGFYSGEKYPRW